MKRSTKTEVEREAKRLCAVEGATGLPSWRELKDFAKDEFREEARKKLAPAEEEDEQHG